MDRRTGGTVSKTSTGQGTHKPCREYAQCRHKKHGYTRKDRPAPRNTRASLKTDQEIKDIAAAYVAVRWK